jgi:hypothetical protein
VSAVGCMPLLGVACGTFVAQSLAANFLKSAHSPTPGGAARTGMLIGQSPMTYTISIQMIYRPTIIYSDIVHVPQQSIGVSFHKYAKRPPASTASAKRPSRKNLISPSPYRSAESGLKLLVLMRGKVGKFHSRRAGRRLGAEAGIGVEIISHYATP